MKPFIPLIIVVVGISILVISFKLYRNSHKIEAPNNTSVDFKNEGYKYDPVKVYDSSIAFLKQEPNFSYFSKGDDYVSWANKLDFYSYESLINGVTYDDSLNKSMRNELKQSLKEYQSRFLSKARKQYSVLADQLLWESNIDVEVSGKQARTITFISSSFSRNESINKVFTELQSVLNLLRFDKVVFCVRPNQSCQFYKLESKNDEFVYSN